jgi:mannose-6-phosphate isomerase-like protein (cupin superfamily)
VKPPRTGRGIKHVPKPWGWELWWARTERYVGKILHVERGHALSYQLHRKKDETIFVLHGQLDLELARPGGRRRRRRLGPGDGVRIRPGDRHRMVAVTTCDILEASSPELDDLVRLEDRYGRVDGASGAGARARRGGRPAPVHSRAKRVQERRQ